MGVGTTRKRAIEDDGETELAVLKKKLMIAAKSAIANARRHHEVSTRLLEGRQSPSIQPEGANPSIHTGDRSPNVNDGVPVGLENRKQQESSAVVMSHTGGKSTHIEEDWQGLSEALRNSLRAVLHDHEGIGQDGSDIKSMFKSVDIIEFVQKDGEVVAKKVTLDLTKDEEKKSELINVVGESNDEDEGQIHMEKHEQIQSQELLEEEADDHIEMPRESNAQPVKTISKLSAIEAAEMLDEGQKKSLLETLQEVIRSFFCFLLNDDTLAVSGF